MYIFLLATQVLLLPSLKNKYNNEIKIKKLTKNVKLNFK